MFSEKGAPLLVTFRAFVHQSKGGKGYDSSASYRKGYFYVLGRNLDRRPYRTRDNGKRSGRRKRDYTTRMYVQVLESQLSDNWIEEMHFVRDNAPINTANIVKDWFK